MTDLNLINRFFAQDLTDGEEQALEDLLAASPDATDFFEEKAKAAYVRYRLPEPRYPGKGASGGWAVWASSPQWVLLAAFLVVVPTGIWGWRYLPGESLSSKVQGLLVHPFQRMMETIPAVPTQALGKPAVTEKLMGASTLSTAGKNNEISSQKVVSKGVEKVPIPLKTSHASPQPEPPAPLYPGSIQGQVGALQPGYHSLRVVVERTTAGLVTVRAVNAEGQEVKVLYAGVVEPGRWAFEWDGRLTDGAKAPLGRYLIEVKSGPVVEKKEVWITK